MSSSSGCLIRSDLFLLLSTTLAPPTSQRLRQVPWLKCVRKMFYVQTHTKTHAQKETASSRDIIVNDDTWNVSSKQFPAVLFLGGSGKRDYLPFSNCSNTWMFIHTQKKSRALNQRDIYWGFQFSPLWLEIPHPTCYWGPPNTADEKVEHQFELNSADLSTAPSGRLSQGHPVLPVGKFLPILSPEFYTWVLYAHLLTCQHCNALWLE